MHEKCCADCARKIDEIHSALIKISEIVGSIDLESMAKNPLFKMLGIGKK